MKKKMSYAEALRQIGVSYLGGTSKSSKTMASEKNGTLTYCIYLSPADISGYNVCPCSKNCRKYCLNGSGLSKVDILSGKNIIQQSRLKKTLAFFENRRAFMEALVHEIKREEKRAKKLGLSFAVRLNGTSDLSPELFVLDGKNILEIFPHIQFYDYTKVFSRLKLMEKFSNYDLTFSFDGHNWNACQKFLEKGGKAAVVFSGHSLPKFFHGFPIVSGNDYDMRYIDPKGHVIGLSYHPVAADYVDLPDGTREFVEPKTEFVIRSDNEFIA